MQKQSKSVQNIVIAPRALNKEEVRTIKTSLEAVGRPNEAITKEMKPLFDKANPVRVTESNIASDLKELFLVPEYETITIKPKEDS